MLPDFPWDALEPFRRRAAESAGGACDLSVGTPVDPVPDAVQSALRDASNSPGYPRAQGSVDLRAAASGWLARAHAVDVDPGNLLALVGTKALVAWLPQMLGLGSRDLVVTPELAYPTYEVGARIAGCRVRRADSLLQLGPERPALVWVNSPSNPTGRVLGVEHLAKIVSWARDRGVIVASDECYIEFGWDAQPPSILHPDVCGGSHVGLLSVHSLSKRSNAAGYRCGFVTGDPDLVAGLVAVAKHAGMMVPGPVQAAGAAAWADGDHVRDQRARYRRRRDLLLAAVGEAGFRVDDSEAGLYVWATRGEPCWTTVAALADCGIVVTPGDFYGPRGGQHVRVALTATEERVATACERLLTLPGVASVSA